MPEEYGANERVKGLWRRRELVREAENWGPRQHETLETLTAETLYEKLAKDSRKVILQVPEDVTEIAEYIMNVPNLSGPIPRTASGYVELKGELKYVFKNPGTDRVVGLWPITGAFYVDIEGLLVESREAKIINNAPFVIAALMANQIPKYYILQGGEHIWALNKPSNLKHGTLPAKEYFVGELPYDRQLRNRDTNISIFIFH